MTELEILSSEERKRLMPFRRRGMEVLTILEKSISDRQQKSFRFGASPDWMLFGCFRLWIVSERTFVRIPELFDLLREKYGKYSSGEKLLRKKKDEPLGIPLKVILGEVALDWLESEAKLRYEGAKQSRNAQERMLAAMDFDLSRFDSRKGIQEEFLGEYKSDLKKMQEAMKNLRIVAKQKPYRNNPWNV